MIKLIVNADDFGYSNGVNYGIIDCHKHGIVNSATMMMNMFGTSHAIELAKTYPTLRVGVHLVLTCGRPLRSDVPSLTDENGFFKKIAHYKENSGFNLDEIEKEWTAQIEKFLESGLTLSHLDSHHHVHHIKELFPVVKKLANRYDVPVRQMEGNSHFEGVKLYSDYLLTDFHREGVREDYFADLHEKIEAGKTVEVMTHPGYLDHYIISGSSYSFDRMKETQVLMNVTLPNGVELV
jgi:predicted glycoside hydrolase/deacetylase ChbG (UPF0249 family)